MRKKAPGQMELGASSVSAPAMPETAFLEYPAPDGVKWRVEFWTDLRKEFGIATGEDMAQLHGKLLSEPRAWRLVRLLYVIAPLVGEMENEYLESHSRSEIADLMEVTDAHLDVELRAAKNFWRKALTVERTGAKVDPVQTLARSYNLPEGDDAKNILRSHGFGDLTDENEKAYVLERIDELSAELESKNRPMAQQAIRLELQMNSYYQIGSKLKADYLATNDIKTRKEIRGEQESIEKLLSSASSQFTAIMKELNLTQSKNPGQRRRAKIQIGLSGLVAAIREYESRGDRELVDGLHTAGEIELLLQPTTLRPPQYRLDLVVLIRDAMKEENLFNPEYVPPTMNRQDYRRLRSAMTLGLAAIEEGEAVRDLEEDFGEEETGGDTRTDRTADGHEGRVEASRVDESLPPMPRLAGAGDEIITG